MLLLRLVTIALCATGVALLASFQPVRIEVRSPAGPRGAAGPAINVVDVAAGVPASRIAALIQLRPDEHVAAIDDRPQISDLEVGALIASRPPRPGEFLDLTVGSPDGERRVLVLLH